VGVSEDSLAAARRLRLVRAELAAGRRARDQLALDSGGPRRSAKNGWTFADGSYHALFETIKHADEGPDGRTIGVLGVARDVTQQRSAVAGSCATAKRSSAPSSARPPTASR
jgi:PAS domain-containing protein